MQTTLLVLGCVTLASPAMLVIVFGLAPLLGVRLSESLIARLTQLAIWTGFLASIGVLAVMLFTGGRHIPIELGNWVAIEEQHFHFHLKLVFDRLSIPLVLLSFCLCGVVGAFTTKYLHRDPGFHRFFVFYALFLLGMVISSVAGTIETLFFGWELVGLSSALLVAYFHERTSPVRNGLRVWSVYRIADAAFLVAALLLHHMTGAGDFDGLMGTGSWPSGVASMTSTQALLVGCLLLVAAAGKSALVPFSGWLPRAMEGPTPSSAVFYGALSVHLGAYLLLRVSPILDRSPVLCGLVVLVGACSALFGTLSARVQCDVKSALAFASLTQVGIIVTEIGLGFRYLPLVHIVGHACLRTLQLLRAPTLLRDYSVMENAIGMRLSMGQVSRSGDAFAHVWRWVYRFASDRGCFDNLLDDLVARPFVSIFVWCDGMERRWTDWLARGSSRQSDDLSTQREIVKETL